MNTDDDRKSLRYLEAKCVAHPTGTLEGLAVRGPNDERIGEVGGVLLECACRRVRYFIVERPALLRTKRYLVPVDSVATLHDKAGTIYIDVDRPLEPFDISSVPRFCDDDLIETLFASTAA